MPIAMLKSRMTMIGKMKRVKAVAARTAPRRAPRIGQTWMPWLILDETVIPRKQMMDKIRD